VRGVLGAPRGGGEGVGAVLPALPQPPATEPSGDGHEGQAAEDEQCEGDGVLDGRDDRGRAPERADDGDQGGDQACFVTDVWALSKPATW
jgi:hypothetical protein